MKQRSSYAEVVFPIPLSRSFDYAVPPGLQEKIAVGSRIRAPFGRRWKTGYVAALKDKSSVPLKTIKPIGELLDEKPLLDERLLELSKWVHAHYLCSWGEALEAMLPSSLRPRQRGFQNVSEEISSPEPPPPLEETFQKSLSQVAEALESHRSKTFLLWEEREGERTEFILQAIQRCLEKERSAIVLYPEISLIPEAVDRLKRRFGKSVGVLHSQLSPLDRYETWKALTEGNARVAVGVRSAVFSPVRHLGLILLCEEHDPNYKQEEVPRYHARQVALMRSTLEGAAVLLVSGTPSVESYTHALKKRYVLLRGPVPRSASPIPKVSVVDMREEGRHQRRKLLFSKYLERRMAGVLQEEKKILLF